MVSIARKTAAISVVVSRTPIPPFMELRMSIREGDAGCSAMEIRRKRNQLRRRFLALAVNHEPAIIDAVRMLIEENPKLAGRWTPDVVRLFVNRPAACEWKLALRLDSPQRMIH